MSTEDFAMLEVAYLLVLVLVKLKSEEERAEHVWGGRRRTSCSSRCLYVIIRIVFLLSHFFSVISVHDRRNDNNSAAIGGYIARAGNANRDTSSAVKMSLSILDLLPVLSGTADEQLSWFQQKGLLSRSQNCPSCGLAMRIQTRNDIQDKRRYIYSVTI